MEAERYALILAGGSGTRFWPLSRHSRPKQLLQLFDEQTLIEKTINRLEGLIPVENILILTNEEQAAETRRVASRLPAENIYAEPAKRDTAPAVALGAGLVARRNPEATMAVLPADQLIQDEEGFRKVLDGALEIARETRHIVTIGIKPTWPCPSYGYIERGDAAQAHATASGIVPHAVRRFREKPTPEVAQEFLAAGNFSWNAGMFIWSVPYLREELAEHCPELDQFVGEVQETEDLERLLKARFAELPKTSIDFALMEKASRIYNIEATFDWDDVGGWLSVASYLGEDAGGNRHRGPLTSVDAAGNVVYSNTEQHVALLGVQDLIVVQTGDALLVAHKDSADEIKKLVNEIPSDLQ